MTNSIEVYKTAWVIVSSVFVFVLALVYFKFVKYPNELLANELKDVVKDLESLEAKVEGLIKTFDDSNKSRVEQAVEFLHFRDRLEEVREDFKRLDDKLYNLRIEFSEAKPKQKRG